MVARRRRQDALLQRGARQLRHLVVGTPDLEGVDALEVFAFQEEVVAELAGKRSRLFERALDRDVVDLGIEDTAQILLLKTLIVHRGSFMQRNRPRTGRLIWGKRRGTIPQPSDPQSDALPIELLSPSKTANSIPNSAGGCNGEIHLFETALQAPAHSGRICAILCNQ